VRRLTTAVVAAAGVVVPFTVAPTAAANPVPSPPYVDHVDWAKWGDLSSLRVFPTDAGREAAGLVAAPQAEQAWAEVLTLSPDADIPGMKAQFICHWEFAELSQPGKASWNLEPWRPEVADDEMLAAGCNPGGTIEPF
jgi:Protein of unknown function (DUF2599)